MTEPFQKVPAGRWRHWAGRAARTALDLLLPPVCTLCCRSLPLAPIPGEPDDFFCPDCLQAIEPMPPARCPACARPLFNSEESHLCGDCLAARPPYRRARAALVYQGGAARSIALLKYGGDLPQLPALAALAGPALASARPPLEDGPEAYDLIVPMPVSDRRLAERGFNQAAELARFIYRPWLKRIEERALVRVRDGDGHQAALSGPERRRAIRRCFEVRASDLVRGSRVLLFDDVLTTGATAGEAAATLLAAGAELVDLAVVARTVLDSWR